MQDLRSRTRSVGSHRLGVIFAVITAVISGFAVFMNGFGLRAWAGTADPTTYTTFKNVVAGSLLAGIAVIATRRGSKQGLTRPTSGGQWASLGLIAVFGGAIAFALFFEGFARASSSQAAFIHKTLIIWVGILAVGLLREKIRPVYFAAIGLLVVGQFLLLGGVSEVSFGVGEAMMLAATLLWSIEVILAKRLLPDLSSLTVGVARMAGGALVLVMYGFAAGGFTAMGHVTLAQVGWILVVGTALSGFVGFWYAALARAPAIEVTAILVGGAVLTAALNVGIRGVSIPSLSGLTMVATGAGVVAIVAYMSESRRPVPSLVDQ
jgi:drug/metabolite transporter (DMT)-like permease